jgi:hypothetical protein
MRSVASLRFHDVPDYNHFRSIFRAPEPASPEVGAADDDGEVILSLRLEKTPAAVASRSGDLSSSKKTTPKKRKQVSFYLYLPVYIIIWQRDFM